MLKQTIEIIHIVQFNLYLLEKGQSKIYIKFKNFFIINKYYIIYEINFLCNFRNGNPVDIMPGWYIRAVVRPKKNETEKYWKFAVLGI